MFLKHWTGQWQSMKWSHCNDEPSTTRIDLKTIAEHDSALYSVQYKLNNKIIEITALQINNTKVALHDETIDATHVEKMKQTLKQQMRCFIMHENTDNAYCSAMHMYKCNTDKLYFRFNIP